MVTMLAAEMLVTGKNALDIYSEVVGQITQLEGRVKSGEFDIPQGVRQMPHVKEEIGGVRQLISDRSIEIAGIQVNYMYENIEIAVAMDYLPPPLFELASRQLDRVHILYKERVGELI